MADRVYPSAKPNPQPPASAGAPPSFPATKSQTYQRPMYRPAALSKAHRRSRGSCCRCLCCWFFIVIILLVFLAAIAGAIFYVLYRPHRPTFTVSSLRLSTFNLTASNLLTSSLDLSITARNPNKKIVFLYDDISVGVTSNGADVGDGSIPGFLHDAKNTTVLKVTAGVSRQSVDPSVVSDLKKSNVQLAVDLETKAGVKVGSLKTKKVGIKVHCEGFQTTTLTKGKPGVTATPDTVCKESRGLWGQHDRETEGEGKGGVSERGRGRGREGEGKRGVSERGRGRGRGRDRQGGRERERVLEG